MNINPSRKTSRKPEEEGKLKDFVRTCQHLFMELLSLINEAITKDALHVAGHCCMWSTFLSVQHDESSAHMGFNPCLVLAMTGKSIILLCKNSSELRVLSAD